jgi:EAL domain-containing protein (putative c-di-GMP-specific phosphodiesterase class I)
MGLTDVVISVKISGQQVTDSSFIDKIVKNIECYKINSNRIELKTTETMLVSDFNIAKEWVEKAQKTQP